MKKTVFLRPVVVLFALLLTQAPEASNSRNNLLKREVKAAIKPVLADVRATALEL